jgi:hypothetical protein
MVKQLSPTLLHNCNEAINDSAAVLRLVGMPANRTACIAHMLYDEQVVACLTPLPYQWKYKKG